MRVYIASKYIEHKIINRQLYAALYSANIEVFLPESINVDAITIDEMFFVSETCYNEIYRSDVLLVVCPIGRSVSSEIGCAITLKRLLSRKILIITYQSDLEHEAMLYPYIDKNFDSIEELIFYLKSM